MCKIRNAFHEKYVHFGITRNLTSTFVQLLFFRTWTQYSSRKIRISWSLLRTRPGVTFQSRRLKGNSFFFLNYKSKEWAKQNTRDIRTTYVSWLRTPRIYEYMQIFRSNMQYSPPWILKKTCTCVFLTYLRKISFRSQLPSDKNDQFTLKGKNGQF